MNVRGPASFEEVARPGLFRLQSLQMARPETSRLRLAASAGLLGLALVLLPFAGLAQSLPFATYSSDDGLAESVVLSLQQDSSGYLWLGTPSGVSRFDGLVFTNFDDSQGLPGSVVRALLEDRRGILWAGTERGLARRAGAAHRDSEAWEALPLGEAAESGVRCLVEAEDGALWAGTFGAGIVRLDVSYLDGPDAGGTRPSDLTVYSTADGLAHDRVRAALRDRRGRLWFGTYGGGVSRFEGGSFINYGSGEGLTNLFVRALAEDSNGNILAGTNGGILRLAGDDQDVPPEGGKRNIVPEGGKRNIVAEGGKRNAFQPYLPSEPAARGPVAAVLEDRRGRLWLGTRDQGACRVDGEKLRCYRQPQGLAGDSINSLYEDREGNLWFGTFGGGASRLSAEGFLNFTARDGLPDDGVEAIAQASLRSPPSGEANSEILLGTHGGGLISVNSDGTIGGGRSLTTAGGLPHDKVLAAFAHPDGSLWLGTLNGAAHIAGGRLETFSAGDGLAHDIVYDFAVDGSGTLWIATHGGLTSRVAGGFKSYTAADGLPADRVNTLLPAAGGGLWLGTAEGLSRLQPGRFVNYTEDDGLAGDFVNSLLERDDGLWIATSGGLSRFASDDFTTYTTADGLAPDKCMVLLEGTDGKLWIGTTRGINVFDGVSFTTYTTGDGLASGEVKQGAGLKDAAGRLWFGTTAGATVFEPGFSLPELPPPPVRVTGVEVLGTPAAATVELRLRHRQNDLRFEFVGISLASPGTVAYEVRLEGLDAGWRATRSRAIHYASVPPGSYAFRVRARHTGGAWSDQAALPFEIVPPVWQTWWFRALAAVLAAALMLAAHRARTAAIRRRAQHLEAVVRERTKELRRLNQKKNEFLGVAAHDLRSPLGGITGTVDLLLSFLDQDRRDDKLWRKFLGNVRTTAEHMRTLVGDLLDVSAIESGKVDLRLESCPMAELLEEHEPIHAQVAHKKDIELVVDTGGAGGDVLADRVRIGEVLDNLMSNALKYTRPGGRVEVRCESANGELVTHVEDSGQGLAPDELARIWDGVRLSPRPTGGETSTGLGLVIVKKLVELHDGRIWAESEKDKGSTFSFSLPRAE